jgi:hypothetical protein
MAFKAGAFLAGLATQAVRIEEESAKIGMELINEAIEDFREESKDWKSQYNSELKEWEQLADYVKEMVGDDARAIAVLKKGKLFASDFIKNARTRADELGLNEPKDLIEFGDETLPKGLSVIDWVKSGAPDMAIPAKPFLDSEQFKEFKTGVFGRQISPEAAGRVDRTTKTFLETPTGIRKQVVPDVEIDLYGTRKVPEAFSSTEEERYRKVVLATLASQSSKVGGVNFDTAGNPIWKIDNAKAIAQIEKHADQIMDKVRAQRASAESEESAFGTTNARDLARDFAQSDVDSLKELYDLNRDQTSPLPPVGGQGSAQQQQQQQQQQQTPSQQTGQTVTTVTPQIANDPSVDSFVTRPSTAPAMGPGKRRQEIEKALIALNVDPTVARQWAQTVQLK